ncbi:MAG: tRNA (N(6)-L-threonylcarbamoyladenosine(37)-C(2))-methylthiotransferase MtaB [Bacilli bacterium]|nr:tRNA (N(6)-L-threonylcarbamoyladenosine(37)-C(2))-methylthiotransferase MtaB [Bacilli bacterium]
MKCCVITLGCKVNSYESEYISESFRLKGYDIVSVEEKPDVVIVNTCTVTNQSDAKSRKIIRQVRKTIPNTILVVCGCSSEHHKDKIVDVDIDILIGNYYKSKIVDLVEQYKIDHKKINTFVDMNNLKFEDMKINNFLNKTRAFVKIQDGCNNYCSYCIIPYMRGNIRSKDIDVAFKEIECLVNRGYQEIVLTGIHTGSYGSGMNYDLVDLIRKISKLDNLKRIRISSIEITELNDRFIEELKLNNKICDHLHIPIQAGSDHILKLMNRKYNIEEFKNIINKIRLVRPNINITTDLIVGFPNETDDDFNETKSNLIDIGFSKIHTFPYSIRDNTPASKMKQVKDSIKKSRVNEILELSDLLENRYYNKYLNKQVNVLIEEVKDNISLGHTDNYIKVIIDKRLDNNKFYNVVINDVVKTDVKGIYKD